jgi:hypothetical protein
MKQRDPSVILKAILPFVLIFSGSLTTFAQTSETPRETPFLIQVETTEDGVKLTGVAGCAFINLAFTLRPGRAQAVNQYGMTTIDEHISPSSEKLANFLFTISRTRDGLSFEGIQGTAWKKLSFSCPDTECRQLIDQNGMTDGW